MTVSRSIEFWSSVELGGFARGLLSALQDAGWETRQRYAVAERHYRTAATPIERAAIRWRSYVSYPLQLLHRMRNEAPPDVMVVCTNSFYAPAVALYAARGRPLPVVHWVLDLFPDVLVESGSVNSGGLADRSLRSLTRATFRHAAANVFLGEHLLQNAARLYGEIPRASIIPVGAGGEPFRTAYPQSREEGAAVKVLYCGNLGRMHDTGTILELLRRGRPQGWSLEFRGHGAGFRSLASALGPDTAVTVGPSLPDAEWARAMKDVDIALVTLKEGAEGLVMPSKTYSAMVAGQAILAVCAAQSDLAKTVQRHDAGWVVAPGDVNGLQTVLTNAAKDPTGLLSKRRNAFRAGHESYDESVVARRWLDLFASITT